MSLVAAASDPFQSFERLAKHPETDHPGGSEQSRLSIFARPFRETKIENRFREGVPQNETKRLISPRPSCS